MSYNQVVEFLNEGLKFYHESYRKFDNPVSEVHNNYLPQVIRLLVESMFIEKIDDDMSDDLRVLCKMLRDKGFIDCDEAIKHMKTV